MRVCVVLVCNTVFRFCNTNYHFGKRSYSSKFSAVPGMERGGGGGIQ